MNVWILAWLCLGCLVACFYLAGLEFEEGKWSPAVIVAAAMLFSAIVASLFTFYVVITM